MLFVDGENLTIRAEEVAKAAGLKLPEGPLYRKGTYVWLPQSAFDGPHSAGLTGRDPRYRLTAIPRLGLRHWGVRAFYYTFVQGSHDDVAAVERALWETGFQPRVFKKTKNLPAKGVDISLATDVLSNAYQDNFDIAVLLTGDGDYVPLIREVQRVGKSVYVAAFNSGLSPQLMLASDEFLEGFEEEFLGSWREQLQR
jgi:hypothetical protein